jgi:hypothetical protein
VEGDPRDGLTGPVETPEIMACSLVARPVRTAGKDTVSGPFDALIGSSRSGSDARAEPDSVDPTEARWLMTVPFSGVVPSVGEDHVRCDGGLSGAYAVLQGLLDSEL